jgi:general secretion pathway protein H
VKFEVLLPENCNHRPVFASISLFASGMSCGGVIALTHLDVGYEIRVNWLTGRIEVVPRGRLANT